MPLAVLDRLRRRWDVPFDPARPLAFPRLRDRINLKRLELLGWIAVTSELVEAAMSLGFGLRGYHWVIAANVAVDLGVIALARTTLAWGPARRQALVPPLAVTAMLLIAQASIYALASMGRFAPVYPLYLLLAALLFVFPPRLLVAIIAGTFLPYVGFVHAMPLAPIDRLSALRTALIAGAVASLAGSLIHAARERDHAQTLTIHDRNAQLSLQNAQMDEVMAFAAHDLRSPLLGLRNLVAFALPRLGADPTLAGRTLEEAGHSLDRTLARIGRLLAAHEAEYGAVHLVEDGDVRLQLTAAAERNALLARTGGVTLQTVLPAHPVAARHDPAALERILDNLIANAVRFSPPGSGVCLRCRCEDGQAILSVEDHGSGIPEGERAGLFDKFGRGQAAQSRGLAGSGLGLFIVGTLTARIDGRIAHRPADPRGSIFEITLAASGS